MNVSPHNLDVERAVLGALMMNDPEAVEEVRALIRPESFYHPSHKTIYRAILGLANAKKPIDQVTLLSSMNGKLEDIGGPYTIASMTRDIATTANVVHHARILQGLHARRTIIARAEQLAQRAYDPSEDVEAVVSTATRLGADITLGRPNPWEVAGDVVEQAIKEASMAAEHPELAVGLSTGIAPLDEKLGGLMGGNLIILAGRPSMGKTALALAIAREVARHAPVCMISAEMTNKALGTRLLAMEGKVNSHTLRLGRLTQEEFQRIRDARTALAGLQLHLADHITRMAEIPAEVRRAHREDGMSLLVVDYLQLLTPDMKHESREREVAQMSKTFKDLTVELDIPILLLAQLNRLVNQRPDKRPALSDLRESGAIEQDADIVLFIHRDAYYGITQKDGEDITDQAQVIIAKNRNGPVGTAHLHYDMATGCFEPWNREVPRWVNE